MKRTVLFVTLFAILGTSSLAAAQQPPVEDEPGQSSSFEPNLPAVYGGGLLGASLGGLVVGFGGAALGAAAGGDLNTAGILGGVGILVGGAGGASLGTYLVDTSAPGSAYGMAAAGAAVGAIAGGLLFAIVQPGLNNDLNVDGPASIAIAGVAGLGVFGLGIMGGYALGAAMAGPPQVSLAPMITDEGSGLVVFGRF